jgi:hypothetical protein
MIYKSLNYECEGIRNTVLKNKRLDNKSIQRIARLRLASVDFFVMQEISVISVNDYYGRRGGDVSCTDL